MSGITINHPSGPGPGDDEPRWTRDEMEEEFEVLGFAAPFVVVRRKADGQRGALEFVQNPGEPRVYFGFVPA
jgi:hypothetical protein